jgi:P27 family predicted phage terminase small subunit
MKHLNDKGLLIYNRIETHCRENLGMIDVDDIELSMLAYSYALYFEMAEYIQENGVKFTIETEKGGSYEQICPEYSVMKNEYQNILKHSAKFGLTPGDRAKIFKDFGKKKDDQETFDELNKPRK